MSDSIDLLSVAAGSPDPKVRSLAIRRMELAAEITQIDLLFASMHQLVTKDAGGQLSGVLPRVGIGFIPKKQFAAIVKNILLAAAQPLRPAEVYMRFKALYPECSIAGPEAMRKRLFSTKDHFQQVEEAGYWPVDYPVPALVVSKEKK